MTKTAQKTNFEIIEQLRKKSIAFLDGAVKVNSHTGVLWVHLLVRHLMRKIYIE